MTWSHSPPQSSSLSVRLRDCVGPSTKLAHPGQKTTHLVNSPNTVLRPAAPPEAPSRGWRNHAAAVRGLARQLRHNRAQLNLHIRPLSPHRENMCDRANCVRARGGGVLPLGCHPVTQQCAEVTRWGALARRSALAAGAEHLAWALCHPTLRASYACGRPPRGWLTESAHVAPCRAAGDRM